MVDKEVIPIQSVTGSVSHTTKSSPIRPGGEPSIHHGSWALAAGSLYLPEGGQCGSSEQDGSHPAARRPVGSHHQPERGSDQRPPLHARPTGLPNHG